MIIRGEEVFFIDNEKDKQQKIIYVPLRGLMFSVEKNVATKLQKGDDGITDMFFEVVLKHQKVSVEQIQNHVDVYPPTLSINLSDNCMLRCIYCYMSSTCNEVSKTMSYDEAIIIIDAFISYALNVRKMKTLKFSFFGGAEPTYDFNSFKRIIEYIKAKSTELNFKYLFGMTTNGYYKEEVMNYIIQNFTKITFSIDGPDFIQNIHRPAMNGKTSFDTVFANAKKLYNSKLKFAFRVTVSKLTLTHWKEVLEFFATEFEGSEVYFAPLLPIGRGNDDDIKEILPKSWQNAAIDMYDTYKHRLNMHFPNVVVPDKIKLHYCGAATAKMWLVSNDGTVSTCPHDRFNPLHIIGKFDFEQQAFDFTTDACDDIQNKFNVLNYPECTDCFCKYTCAGGCPSQRVFGLEPVCNLTRTLTAKLFNDILEKNN